jgi:hypothetical protein
VCFPCQILWFSLVKSMIKLFPYPHLYLTRSVFHLAFLSAWNMVRLTF